MHDVSNALRARNNTPVGSGRLTCIPLKKLTAPNDFKTSLGERLAMFRRDGGGDFLLPLAHDGRGFQKNIGPFNRRHLAPDFEPCLGCCERVVQVALVRMRQAPDLFFGRRIQYGKVIGGLAPFAVDIKMQVWIGTHRSSQIGYGDSLY